MDADQIVADLVRSAWIVERSRIRVYEMWAAHDPAFKQFADRVGDAAAALATGLSELGRRPDESLVEAHTAWMTGLIGTEPHQVPFGDLFLARLGDWVEGHAGPFLSPDKAATLNAVGEDLKSLLTFPDSLPEPEPFRALATLPIETPGEVLFRFAILADIHIGSTQGETMARAAIEDINASGAELVIQLGDLADHGNREEFAQAASVLETLQAPWHVIMGNHDAYSLAETRLAGREYFEEYFGRPPDGRLVEHEGFRFALLDSVEHGASPFAPFDLVTGTFLEGTGGAVVRGAFSVPQHDLLAEIASPGAPPAFVFLHHPPQPFTSFPPVLFGLREADSGRLHAVADSGNVWGIFAGHTHRNAHPGAVGPAPVQEVGIPRDYPFGYALVDVTAHGYAYRFVQLSNEELLRAAHRNVGVIHRRYALGGETARGFAWVRPK